MQQLTESLFYGTWRSYKAFQKSGDVKNHTKDKYEEFDFGDKKHLTISVYNNGSGKKQEETKDWTVIFKNKHHYLSINGKGLEYEVVTINHVAFVLMNTKTNEKVFFARPETWESYITTSPSHAAL